MIWLLFYGAVLSHLISMLRPGFGIYLVAHLINGKGFQSRCPSEDLGILIF